MINKFIKVKIRSSGVDIIFKDSNKILFIGNTQLRSILNKHSRKTSISNLNFVSIKLAKHILEEA